MLAVLYSKQLLSCVDPCTMSFCGSHSLYRIDELEAGAESLR